MRKWLRRIFVVIALVAAVGLAAPIVRGATSWFKDGYVTDEGKFFKEFTPADGITFDVEVPPEFTPVLDMESATDMESQDLFGMTVTVAWYYKDQAPDTPEWQIVWAKDKKYVIAAIYWTKDKFYGAWAYDYTDPLKYNKDPKPIPGGVRGLEEWITKYIVYISKKPEITEPTPGEKPKI